MNIAETIAGDLLRIKAFILRPNDPITWASGIKSPMYCDNRLILSDVTARKDMAKGMAETIQTYFPNAEILMGTATAGIAPAALAAAELDMPMGYVRSSNKSHGLGKQIEGKLEQGQKVVVVEDLISTAGSSIEVVKVLREAGADVLGIVSIMTYGLKAGLENLANANVVNHSLCTLDALLPIAVQLGYINENEKEQILRFRQNPNDESWMNQ